MHTLIVVEDGEVAEQVTQFLDEHGISLPIYDFGHNDPVTIQSFQSSEIPILIPLLKRNAIGTFTVVPQMSLLMFHYSQLTNTQITNSS